MKRFGFLSQVLRDSGRRNGSSPAKPARPRLALEKLGDRDLPSTTFVQTNLVSSVPGLARIADTNLIEPFGIALDSVHSASQSFGFAISDLLSNSGDVFALGQNPLNRPSSITLDQGAPTGVVFNATGSNTDFLITGASTRPSVFLFATQTGEILGWNPLVGEQDFNGNIQTFSLTGHLGFQAKDGAIYTGLTLGNVGASNFIFAVDNHGEKIDVIDGQFQKVTLGANGFESFIDPIKPSGYAPSNIQNVNGKLYVTYALDGTEPTDPVAGRGFIDVFETNGHFDGRLVTGGDLNNPYGLALAPAKFGDFSGALLVGNIGDGRIHAYNPITGAELGTLNGPNGQPLAITGLHGLTFGAGAGQVGDANTLYFVASLGQNGQGLFGNIDVNPGTAPKVTNVVVNGGAAQRSRVTQLQVAFDQHVTLPANPTDAFRLFRQSDNAGVTLSATVDDTGAGTVVSFTFTGGALESESLADGRYTLTALASQVASPNGALDGDGNGVNGDDFSLVGNATNKLFRLFGDATGDGIVDAVDLGQFRSTLNAALGFNPNYLAFLDANGDGIVDAIDLGQFRSRLNTSI